MTDRELMQQPEALRLAEQLENNIYELPADERGWSDNDEGDHLPNNCIRDAAAELRRLYANNTDLLNALRDCAAWMEDLRASGDAGNWDWEADEYTRAMEAIAKATGEQQ